MSPSSSSDTEDEEERRKLALAVDPTFLKTTSLNGNDGGNCSNRESEAPPSKRMKWNDDTFELNEFDKPYSLNVTPECQKFIAKQLSKTLEKNLKGVSPPLPSFETQEEADMGIKLFATSQVHITAKDLEENKNPPKKQRKPKVKKKKDKHKNGTSHSADSSSDSEEERLKSVAVSAEWVLQKD
ncbi:unnamed protein product [Orchesella dallaii]|uniref:Protein CUSTOS n=1 Tax=Orchesella dallaii TaxID=48710 RepID=A0ABP1PUI3_9HEXA